MKLQIVGLSALMMAGTGAAAMTVNEMWRDAFGYATTELQAADVRADAEAGFDVADADGNGLIDETEFASFTVVTAELAQFSGLVAIEADHMVRIDLPTAPGTVLTLKERHELEAKAARRYAVMSEKGAPMDKMDWVHFQLSRFEAADSDGNGHLEGAELSQYAANIAELDRGLS